MNLKASLKQFGLNKKQTDTYIACLELGEASAYKISQHTKLPRSTCYEVFNELIKRKLVTTFRKKKVKYYTVNNIKEAIEHEKSNLSNLEGALPEFNALYKSGTEKPNVRLYEGISGMKTVVNEIDNEADEVLGISNAEMLIHFGPFWEKHIQKRVANKIPARTIITDSEKARERAEKGPKELRTVKIIPAKFVHNSTIVIWKNKVAVFTYKKEMMAFIIESSEYAKSQKQMFEFMWGII
jgi:sugar-specific transcriptional regulator TrmB